MMNADMSLEDEKKTPELEDVKVAEAEALAADALRAAEEARSAAAKLADLRASIQVPEQNEPQMEEAVDPVEAVAEPQDEKVLDVAANDAVFATEEVVAPKASEPEIWTPAESDANEADLPQQTPEVRKDIFARLFDAMGMDNLCGTSSAQVYADPMDNGIPVDFMSEADTVPVDEESVALNTIPGSTPEATGEVTSVPVPVAEMSTPVPEEPVETETSLAEEASEVATPVTENAAEPIVMATKEVIEEAPAVSEETVEESVPAEKTLPVLEEPTAEVVAEEEIVAEEACPVAGESTQESAPDVEEVTEEAAPVAEDTPDTENSVAEEAAEMTVPVAEETSPVSSRDIPVVEQTPAASKEAHVVTPEPIHIPSSQKEGAGELSVVKQTILLDRKRNKLLAKPDPFSGEVESLDFIACGNGDVACGAPTAFPDVDDDSLVEETEVTVATSPIICGWGA
eukprot:Nitzschia sp. Nitz4//scaffold76_size158648//21774//23144//NITZ4_002532-RA/size158648-processed-gene-0.230-mRNA-1//1//CDS//3329557803//8064//frame0